MLDFIFKKKKYLNCPYLTNGIHFFYDEIRACCSNAKGPVFYKDYDGSTPLDWAYIYKKRKDYIKEINSVFNKKAVPAECEGCYLVPKFLSDKKVPEFDNKISTFFIQNNMSCNAKCIYCVFADVNRGHKYNIVPVFKDLIEKSLFDKKSTLMLSGGEITIISDFEEFVNLIVSNFDSNFCISTSGIKYSPAIERAFAQNKCWMTISLDSGTKETYLKLKRVDCFNQIIENLKNYNKKSPNAGNCTVLKYIIAEGINDNIQEIENFINVVSELGIKNVELSVNYEEYSCNNDKVVPDYYFELCDKFKELADAKNIRFTIGEQTQAILNKGKINF